MVCTSDSGMKLYEIEEYSDHEYITGYHAWNVTYFIDVIYGADMHYYISMKRGFIMTPETEIVKKQILSTENAEILLEENEAKRYWNHDFMREEKDDESGIVWEYSDGT